MTSVPEDKIKEEIIWLKERNVNTEIIDIFIELESSIFKECEKILEEWGFVRVYSINLLKYYVRKDGTIRIYRPGKLGNKINELFLRYYDPKYKSIYTYINAMETARYNLSRDIQELVGMSKLMTESLYESNVTLTESDVVSFMYCGGKEKKDINLKYLGKIEYGTFTNNKRSHTAKWIKKARNI